MDNDRRKFLKIAGLSTIAGLGAPAAFEMLLKGEAPRSALASAPSHGAAAAAPAGKQYGFVINTKVFADMPGLANKCIEACHSIHNVPDFQNKKDEIKWIWETKYHNAFTVENPHLAHNVEERNFMVLCNHCANPSCVRACPTKATFKNDDGMVLMDYHRCIGCRFCMAACPYGMRSFNWRDPRGVDKETGRPFIARINPEFPTRMRGVVEKCSMCSELVEKGGIPKCVEVAGNTGAIIWGDLNDKNSAINKVLAENFTIQRKPELGTQPSIFYIV